MDPKEPCTCERETQESSQDVVNRYFKNALPLTCIKSSFQNMFSPCPPTPRSSIYDPGENVPNPSAGDMEVSQIKNTLLVPISFSNFLTRMNL